MQNRCPVTPTRGIFEVRDTSSTEIKRRRRGELIHEKSKQRRAISHIWVAYWLRIQRIANIKRANATMQLEKHLIDGLLKVDDLSNLGCVLNGNTKTNKLHGNASNDPN